MAKTTKQAAGASGSGRGNDNRTDGERKIVKRVNSRLVLILAVAAIVSGGGVHALHAFMVDRNAGDLRERATQAELAGNTQEAINYLSQYLQLRRDDLDATEQLASLLKPNAENPAVARRIYTLLEDVLRKDPTRDRVRRTLIDAAMTLERFADAEHHIDALVPREARDVDADLVALKARAKAGLGRTRVAVLLYLAAADLEPGLVEPYAAAAELLADHRDALPVRNAPSAKADSSLGQFPDIRDTIDREKHPVWRVILDELISEDGPLVGLLPRAGANASESSIAELVLDRMVEEANPTWSALMARARFRSGHGDLAGASADARRALTDPAAKRSSDALMTAAVIEIAAGERATAEGDAPRAAEHRSAALDLARAGLAAVPPEPRFHLLQAQVEILGNATPEAVQAALQTLRAGIAASDSLAEKASGIAKSRLAETELTLRWTLADLLLVSAESDSAKRGDVEKSVRDEIKELVEGGCRPHLVTFLEARLALLRREWAVAASQLESARLGLLDLPDMLRRIDLLLGGCYARLESPDRRIEVFRRAKTAAPFWTPARIGLAEALADARRVDEALAEYETLKEVPGVAAAVARLVMLREFRKPASDRDLKAVDIAIAAVEASAPGSAAATVLRAESLKAQGKYGEAETLLVKAAQENPEARDLWFSRFSAATARDDQPAADRIAAGRALLTDAEQRFGDGAEVRLAKAELARLDAPETLRAALPTLSEGADGFTDDERIKLYEGLIRYATLIDADDVAGLLWRKSLEVRPQDLGIRLAVAQVAADAGDWDALRSELAEIRRIEGPEGPNGDFVEAFAALQRHSKNAELRKNPTALREALAEPRRLLERAAGHRSYWAAIPRALGLLETVIHDSEKTPIKQRDAAFRQFQRARQLGDLSPEVVRGLIEYHWAHERFDLADAVIRQAESENPASMTGELGRLAWGTAVRQGRIDTAIGLASRVADRSSNFRDRIYHAHLLFAKYTSLPEAERTQPEGKKLLDESRKVYRSIVEEHAHEPAAWFAYVVHLSRSGDQDAARAAIADAAKKLPVEPAAARLLCLAQCYGVAQESELAVEHYRKAIETAPNDVQVRVAAADYFGRAGNLPEANTHLKWLLASEHDVPETVVDWARRRQAITMAAGGRYEDVTQALKMLRGADGDEVSVQELRTQASILARQVSLRDRQQLLQILEEIRSRPDSDLAASEKLLLAGLYERTGKWPKGREILEELAAADQGNPTYEAAILLGSLRNDLPHATAEDKAALERELGDRLGKLTAGEPETSRTALLAAEFHARFGRVDEAETLLGSHVAAFVHVDGRGGAEVTDEERKELRILARAAEDLKLYGATEKLLTRLADGSSQTEDSLALPMFLGRVGRYGEALALIDSRSAELKPEVTAIAAVGVVSQGRPSPEHLKSAESKVDAALKAVPDSTQTLNVLGGLRLAQGRYVEAETIYRRVLAEDPRQASAMNNLAWVLVITGENLDEADRLVSDAVAQVGPLADLIDTRGMIYLARRRPDRAIKELADAFADTPTPAMGFHLSLAYEQTGDRAEARRRLDAAHRLGLGIDRLHVTEHQSYETLIKRLDADADR